jgi:hypothetical protein
LVPETPGKGQNVKMGNWHPLPIGESAKEGGVFF